MSDAAPRFETRRQKELLQELVARAKLWLPDWRPKQGSADFGLALLRLAARLESEVTQRLDRLPEKNFRGFLHWMGVRGEPARPARLPVVFKMTAGADPVLAPLATRLQAQAGEESVTFETTEEVQVLPGALTRLIGVDPALDAYYLAIDSVLATQAPEPLPTEWRVKSFAAAGSRTLQLSPQLGLAEERVLEIGGQEYRIVKIDSDIVTVEPALGAEVAADAVARAVTQFAPFSGTARNRQEHHLYVGDDELLNVESPVRIELHNAAALAASDWRFWGKLTDDAPLEWLPIEVDAQGTILQLQKKQPVAIEPLDVNGVATRWLRATVPPGVQSAIEVGDLQLRVNATAPPANSTQPAPQVAVEGFANTTPLVMDREFYPLGREPRLFDTFYLGSPEAFSKPGAEVTVHMEMADPTMMRFAVGRHPHNIALAMVFGVGRNGDLNRIEINASSVAVARFLDPTRPQTSDATPGAPRGSGSVIPLDEDPGYAPAVFDIGPVTYVAAASGRELWLWIDVDEPRVNRWSPLAFQDHGPAEGVLLITYTGFINALAVAADGKLWRRDIRAGQSWQELGDAAGDQNAVDVRPVARVEAIRDFGSVQTRPSETTGFVAVSRLGTIHVRRGANWLPPAAVGDVDTAVPPLAVTTGANDVLVVAKARGQQKLLACHFLAGVLQPVTEVDCDLAGPPIGFGVVTAAATATNPAILVRTQSAGEQPKLSWWYPLDAQFADVLFSEPAPEGAILSGPPVHTDGRVIVPGNDRDVLVASFSRAREHAFNLQPADVHEAILFESVSPQVQTGDLLEARFQSSRQMRTVQQRLTDAGQRAAFRLDQQFDPAADVTSVRVFSPPGAQLAGTQESDKKIRLPGLISLAADDVLVIEFPAGEFATYRVRTPPVQQAGDTIVTVWEDMPGNNGDPMPCWTFHNPLTLPAIARPALTLAQTDFDLVQAGGSIYTPTGEPMRQRALLADPVARIVVLEEPWDTAPQVQAGNIAFRVSAAQEAWQRAVASTIANPELSWEYFNGQAWLSMGLQTESTEQLLRTGDVQFTVPQGLKPTEVAGKPGYWIRARLVGGDYGQESVRVEPVGTGQTVVRDPSTIHPPRVLSIEITYRSATSLPQRVVTLDSGAFRDQSDANRTPGAIVEAFVPLATMLQRLQKAAAETGGSVHDEACECDPCKCADSDDADDSAASANIGGRALYFAIEGAFARPLASGDIRILMLIEERTHDAAFPVQVEILRGGRFEPAGRTDDGTRGLSESGLISFGLARPPTLASLFGKDAFWIRIRPNARTTQTAWKPVVRGAFLNAAFALATDTQEVEIVGSSDGSPDQRLLLARAPIVRDSLDLRIREPLGEEEQEELRRDDPARVVPQVSELRGPWVRWRETGDPHDHRADERVFALDHETGEITFGNGTRGRLPPAGRDNVLAVRYQRAGTALANQVLAWSSLNLVTPLPGVEEVIAPEGAAGGSDAEDVATTLRFGPARLRHRDRVLTARDLEQLALQFSPLITQARTFPSADGVQLTIAGLARDPVPSRPLRRELQRFLIERAPPDFARPRALQVVPPELVRVRVLLKLAAPENDGVGELGKRVKQLVEEYFDPAVGGIGGLGWRLGERPADFELAAKLDALSGLGGVASVQFVRVAADGSEAPLPENVAPTQLVCLAAEGIEIEFEQSAAEAAT